MIVWEQDLHLLPDDADLRSAALLSSGAIAMTAFEAAAPKPGERIVVLGAGVCALLLVQLLAAASPAELVVVDASPERGALAVALGATKHCSSLDAARLEDTFTVVVETTGSTEAAQASCLLAASEARVVFTRLFPPGTLLDRVQLSLRRLTIRGASVASPVGWSGAVRTLGTGILDPRPLITRETALTDGALLEANSLVTVVLSP
ncbi:zinc-binding dehydrogenase [Streptomyces sp. DH41]|uniref:zinc-binding dehydrogenase n=1 Tax=Streptomyces sp. DH41 TaxID=3040125 RepID=UPI002441FA9D|nr:zinc-binding dehydrogenase [Streptomyces sp. DH41]MDG9724344.1 hypothetical protein [Streptomyces sp. DH41]